MNKYYIRYEVMGGNWYYMIYHQFFILHAFYERWNTEKSAVVRLNELNDWR